MGLGVGERVEICEATAAPRRPRAAVINDAFPRPHANFQFFYSKSYFLMFNW